MQFLEGQLLKIEDEFYVLKDATGKEIRLHANKDSLVDAHVKPGDQVTIQVFSDGQIFTVFKAKTK